eukprot:SAG22_NODE_74_length_22289_cov_65.265119_30_plen_68_part_00
MTARRLFGPLLDRIDVVELSAEVMAAAQDHFGLVEDELVKVRERVCERDRASERRERDCERETRDER